MRRQELEAANAALEQRVRERTAQLAATIRRLESEVAERLRIAQELRAASLYARGLIEASLDPLVTISPEGKITDVNEATVAATGVPRERLVGSDFSDYFTEPERAGGLPESALRRAGPRLSADDPPRRRPDDRRALQRRGLPERGGRGAGRLRRRPRRHRAAAGGEGTRQYRAHLEELVQQRTEELRAANVQLEKEVAERKRAAEEAERLATFPRLNPNPDHRGGLGRAGRLCQPRPPCNCSRTSSRRQLAHPWLADWEQVVARRCGRARARRSVTGR